MKKTLIALIILTLSLGVVGCTSDKEETTSITYENSDNNTVGEFVIAGYGISFDKDSNIRYISSRMSLIVNDDEMKTKEFKFEETEFYKLKNILIPEVNNIDEINKKITEGYKNLTSSKGIDFENENIEERILLGENRLVYTIIINP